MVSSKDVLSIFDTKPNMDNVETLSYIVNKNTRDLPSLVQIVHNCYPETSLVAGDVIILNQLQTEKRVLCRLNDNKLDSNEFLTFPGDWNHFNIEVLKSSKVLTITEVVNQAKRDWLKPLWTDVPQLHSETAVKFIGYLYNDHKTSSLVFRGATGQDYFVASETNSLFYELRHPRPISLQTAINMFSLPLLFSIYLPGNTHPDLKDYKSGFLFDTLNWFTKKTSTNAFNNPVSLHLEAFCFITLQSVSCHKMSPETNERLGPEIILPNFVLESILTKPLDDSKLSAKLPTLNYQFCLEKWTKYHQQHPLELKEPSIFWHLDCKENDLKNKKWQVLQIRESEMDD